MDSKKEKVIIFGLGQIAEVAHYYLTHDSKYEIAGFTVDKAWLKESEFHELPVVPFEEIQSIFSPKEYKLFAPISYRDVNKIREKKYFEIKSKGYQMISYVCSKAITWPDLNVGENCFIFENNVIQPYAKIGNNVILWSGNHIGHHSVIKDHCFITSHVVISGGVIIEPRCFLGVNSTVRDNVHIAENCVIGAGAIITKDTVLDSVYYSAGANILKKDISKLERI